MENLESYSQIAVTSAGAIFVISFIFFIYNLALQISAAKSFDQKIFDIKTVKAKKATGSASALIWLGFFVLAAGVIMRGISAARVPWSNNYEYTITACALAIAVYLIVNFFADIKFIGVFLSGVVVLALVLAQTTWYVDIKPLIPALQSTWLVVHVLVAIASTAFFILAACASFLQLVRENADKKGKTLPVKIPSSSDLESLAARLIAIGFVLWTFTLIFGAIWANAAWGRYWGWDTKETWTLIIWIVYAGYLHARLTKGWGQRALAILSLVGFLCVVFNFGVVNTLFSSLHSYSGV